MESTANLIPVPYTDGIINSFLQDNAEVSQNFTRHFTHKEEFFLQFDKTFEVFPVPFHHDISKNEPSKIYLKSIRQTFEQVISLAPQVFSGLNYFFNPGEVLRPGFFQIYKIKDTYFLYLLKIDLQFRATEQTLIQQGTNDLSHHYKTNKLFIDADLIPLDNIQKQENKISGFYIHQLISSTWIRETGRGYSIQGIWIDHELTKFFSKLFLPQGRKYYPYYPFQCKYKTITYNFIELDPESRKKDALFLYHAMQFLNDSTIEQIQKELKNTVFSQELPTFRNLKTTLAPYWSKVWRPYTMKAYLNTQDQKEFLVELQ